MAKRAVTLNSQTTSHARLDATAQVKDLTVNPTSNSLCGASYQVGS
jgi:hypothetical protein